MSAAKTMISLVPLFSDLVASLALQRIDGERDPEDVLMVSC